MTLVDNLRHFSILLQCCVRGQPSRRIAGNGMPSLKVAAALGVPLNVGMLYTSESGATIPYVIDYK
jgi:hypothetical protein